MRVYLGGAMMFPLARPEVWERFKVNHNEPSQFIRRGKLETMGKPFRGSRSEMVCNKSICQYVSLPLLAKD